MTTAPLTGLIFLIARVFFGLSFAAHGAQKLLGWFGGAGLVATAGLFDKWGFRPGRLLALAAGLGEGLGGLLLALGLLGPVGPAMMVAVMVVALGVNSPNGYFATNRGVELPLLYFFAALLFGMTGSGAFSLDVVLGLDWAIEPVVSLGLLALGGLAGGLNLLLRRRPAA